MDDIYYKDTNAALEKYREPTAKWWLIHGNLSLFPIDETHRPNFPRHGITEPSSQKKTKLD